MTVAIQRSGCQVRATVSDVTSTSSSGPRPPVALVVAGTPGREVEARDGTAEVVMMSFGRAQRPSEQVEDRSCSDASRHVWHGAGRRFVARRGVKLPADQRSVRADPTQGRAQPTEVHVKPPDVRRFAGTGVGNRKEVIHQREPALSQKGCSKPALAVRCCGSPGPHPEHPAAVGGLLSSKPELIAGTHDRFRKYSLGCANTSCVCFRIVRPASADRLTAANHPGGRVLSSASVMSVSIKPWLAGRQPSRVAGCSR